MIERKRLHPKRKANSKSVVSAPARQWTLFGQPQLLEGEDRAAYDALFACMRSTVKPADIIDEMFLADLVPLEFEVLRWRRLKSILLQTRALSALRAFLREKFDYDLYCDEFADRLAEILQCNVSQDQADFARTLARECAQNLKADVVDKVSEVLAGTNTTVGNILEKFKTDKSKQLVEEYVRRKPEAVTLVNELFTAAGMSMDGLIANALVQVLDHIERIDRLTAIAESRRNACLHEIERRRVFLGETMRRSVQEVEEGEFEVIETTPAKERNAR